ncbi:MAG TPA: 50S ribosomal protein L11 methyltransferase [Myxococcota bacterium]|nr:50S ribosomal protein L11 methyltransferase [Myxococcota bacterium]HNH46579.1 50S ribosomal protein L11 methyltransferase [Myxococcota bacterium]
MSERWFALALLLPRKEATAASLELVRMGATGVQEDYPPGHTPRFRQPWDKGPPPRKPRNVLLRAWFSQKPASLGILETMALEQPTWEVQDAQDWEEGWKKNFDTLVISERLTITPPWKPIPGAVVIEPGNAFGTGDHPTTRACLRAIDRYATPGATLLDVGCGSGILALAAARLGMVAQGVDIDPDAVRAAQNAATENGLDVAFSTTDVADIAGPYDWVVANLYAEVLAELAPQLLRLSRRFSFAGILADRAHLVRNAFAELGSPEEEVETDWVSMIYV